MLGYAPYQEGMVAEWGGGGGRLLLTAVRCGDLRDLRAYNFHSMSSSVQCSPREEYLPAPTALPFGFKNCNIVNQLCVSHKLQLPNGKGDGQRQRGKGYCALVYRGMR